LVIGELKIWGKRTPRSRTHNFGTPEQIPQILILNRPWTWPRNSENFVQMARGIRSCATFILRNCVLGASHPHPCTIGAKYGVVTIKPECTSKHFMYRSTHKNLLKTNGNSMMQNINTVTKCCMNRDLPNKIHSLQVL